MSVRDVSRRAVAALPPALRWRTRNAVALARWLRLRASGGTAPLAYEDAFWALHDSGDWDGFAAVILHFCDPTSLVDVGCGDGKLLAAIHRRHPSMPVMGIDSSPSALDRVAAAGVPVCRHDLSSTRTDALAAVRAIIGGFDVAVSLETAEHLPPWAGAGFVDSLARVRLVVFSAAQPGQGGTLHMNERTPAYWRERFATRGFAPAAANEALRDAVRQIDLPPWYAANIHLFERRG